MFKKTKVCTGLMLAFGGTLAISSLPAMAQQQLERVEITGLKEGTFFATLKVRRDGESVEVDSRPSDAIALAVRTGAPIFVAEEVLKDAAEVPKS